MSAKFLESVSGKLAEQWVATLLTPAFLFWAGGLAALLQRYGWTAIATPFNQQSESLQIAILVGSLGLILISAFVVQRFDLAVLRFLEGYWPFWLHPLRRLLFKRQFAHSQHLDRRWQTVKADLEQSKLTETQWQDFYTLQQQDPTHLPPIQQQQFQKLANQIQRLTEYQTEFAQLDWQRLHLPPPDRLMPTRLGNLLRSAELRPLEKYGLDAVICWPRLWLLLPDTAKQELQTARADLNTAARVWLWSLLFTLWAALGVWWALPIGVLSAAFAYTWILSAAGTYADLIESAFDLYRQLLYQSLRWPLPPNPQADRQAGQALTHYLWRGSDSDRPTFTP